MGGEVSFDSLVKEANRQLERVSIRAKDGRLYLRGRRPDSFPPRPGEQQSRRPELGLRLSATPAGLKIAIARAKEVDSQLLWGKFDWMPWLKGKDRRPETVIEWVERFTQHHWQHTARTRTKERSFGNSYLFYFGKLPQQKPLSIELLRRKILDPDTPGAGTRSRQFYCMAYGKLAEFAAKHGEIPSDELASFKAELRELRRGYSPEEILPEDLPTDNEIVEIWQSIKNPSWRWLYGMLATYGLRPHEIFHLDLERFTQTTDALRVLEPTKTGARLTYPCPSRWRQQFQLWNWSLPNIDITDKSNEEIGKKVSQKFRELKITHIPYALRHAWCIRTVLNGVPDSVASKWAGHSIQVHVKTYHQAISEAQQRQVFEEMKKREVDVSVNP